VYAGGIFPCLHDVDANRQHPRRTQRDAHHIAASLATLE
jgi:hypothetical protein